MRLIFLRPETQTQILQTQPDSLLWAQALKDPVWLVLPVRETELMRRVFQFQKRIWRAYWAEKAGDTEASPAQEVEANPD